MQLCMNLQIKDSFSEVFTKGTNVAVSYLLCVMFYMMYTLCTIYERFTLLMMYNTDDVIIASPLLSPGPTEAVGGAAPQTADGAPAEAPSPPPTVAGVTETAEPATGTPHAAGHATTGSCCRRRAATGIHMRDTAGFMSSMLMELMLWSKIIWRVKVGVRVLGAFCCMKKNPHLVLSLATI